MKARNRITSTLLALLMSLSMVVTYMPASMIAYATGEENNGTQVEQSYDSTNAIANDTQGIDIEATEKDDSATPTVDMQNEEGEVDGAAEVVAADDAINVDNAGDVVEAENADTGDASDVVETGDSDTDIEVVEDAPVDQANSFDELTDETDDQNLEDQELLKGAAKSTKTGTVLAFSSDVHNKSNNVSANRLGTWIEKVESIHGDIDVMAFGGDMADAFVDSSTFWTLTQADMEVLVEKDVPGLYTTGNHEYSPGGYSASSTNSTQKAYKINTQGAEGSNYRIYCLGSVSSSSSYANQVSSLTSYLNSIGNDKPIFIITHFPLHYYNSRTTTGASDIIDVLNNAVTNNGQKIVFLWGHNHTMSDTYYDYIYRPGDSIPTSSSSSSNKEIKFYYGAAGCMSDSDYGTGSGYVKGKGLVVTINDSNELSFTYYDANGNNVSEGGTFSEITATGITINDVTETGDDGQQVVVEKPTIATGKTLQLQVTFEPAGAAGNVTWSSSDESIATVSGSGVVKGISEGTATITATLASSTKRGGTTASIDVTIGPRGPEPTYELTSTLEPGKKYIIANGNSGTVHALTNNNGSVASTDVTVEGDTITTDNTDIVFTAEGSGETIDNIENGDLYLYAGRASGSYTVSLTLNSSASSGRPWSYGTDNKLISKTSSNTYYLYYSNSNFTVTTSANGTSSREVYLFAESEGSSDPVAITGVSLDKTSLSLEAGETETLTATFTPSNASNKNVTWTTSDANVATIANGTITAVAEGTATITVTTADGGKTATCEVTVAAPSAKTTRYVETDRFEANEEYIVAVEKGNGEVYALKNAGSGNLGSEILTVYPADSKSAAYVITTDASLPWSYTTNTRNRISNDSRYLTINSSSKVLQTDTTGSYAITYNANSKIELTYPGSTSGNIYYVKHNGSNFVATSANDSASATTIKLYVKTEVPTEQVDATGITLNKSSLELSAGETDTLTATLEPENATSTVAWSSSNESVATVANGVVTAVGAGTATITASAGEGVTATCSVTVTEPEAVRYVEVHELQEGKNYIIAVTKDDNTVYVIRNNNGSLATAELAITPQSGDSAAYIETGNTSVVWKYHGGSDNLLTNQTNYYLNITNSGSARDLYISTSNAYGVDYTNSRMYLQYFSQSTSRYYIECSNGTFSAGAKNDSSSAAAIRLFEEYTAPASVSGVTLDKNSMEVNIGGTKKLTATVEPTNAGNKNVTWESSDTSIATVDATGNVTGVAEGTATITVTTEEGDKTDTCTVTVTKQKTYLIIINDHAMSTGISNDQYISNTSYHYHGLAGVAYDSNTVINDSIRWVITETEGGYSIQSLDGKYLNAYYTATSNPTGCNADLSLESLDDNSTPDVWVLDDGVDLDSWKVEGSHLKSTNATTESKEIYLAEETGTNNGTSLFTLRSANGYDISIIEEVGDPVAVTGVTVSPETAEVSVGQVAQLTATVSPENATNKGIEWSSSDTTVATVDDTGKVTGVAEGNAIITATTSDGGKTATCVVTVTPSTEVKYELTDTLENGGEYLIVNANSGSAYALKNPGGTSDGVSIANTNYKTSVTVQNGNYILTSDEDIVWTATTNGDGFNLTNNGDYLEGKSNYIRACNPQSYANRYWTYNSNHQLRHINPSSTSSYYTLRYSSSNYFTGNTTTTTGTVYLFKKVSSTPVAVIGVELDKDALALEEGQSETLTATVKPANATNKNVTWESSDSTVATVSNGTVTAVAAGTATITVTTADGGKTATAQITVTEPKPGEKYILVDSLKNEKEYLIVSAGSVGSAYALKNPGGTSDGVNVLTAPVVIKDGDVNGDGTSDTYIETSAKDIVWTATTNNTGFDLSNDGSYFEFKSGYLKIFKPQMTPTRFWEYSDGQLQVLIASSSSSSYYNVYYDGSTFTQTTASSSRLVYIFEKVTGDIPHEHTYGTPEYTWAADNSTCTATAVCSGCEEGTDGHSVTETVDAAYAVTTPASCAAAGIGTYTASFASELFTAQSKTVEIQATGHDWDGPVWNWTANDNGYTAKATFTCKNDSSHVDVKDAEVTKTSGGGQTTYTATVTGSDGNTYTDTKSVVDEEYNLWVNGIRVNSVNKNNIMGGGEASYDPQTMTLTLNNANITEPYTLDNNDVGLIYSDLGSGTTLTIKGTASLIPAGSSSSDVIRMASGNLTFDGEDTNITAKSKTNVINAGSSTVTFNNGTVDCETTTNNYVCIYGKNIVVNDGKLTAESLANVISGDKIDVNGGEVTAVSTGTSGGSSGFNSKEININGGMVNVNARSRDLYAHNAGSINIIGGIVNLSGSNVGIYGSNSSLTIRGGTVTSASSINVDHDASISGGTVHLTGDSAMIYVKRNLTISGENTVVELDKGTVQTIDGLITIESPLGIVLPTNYVISSNSKKLVDEETGWAEATHILISKPILLTVMFNNQGHGVKPADITNVRYGTTIESPGDLAEDGWVFGGWYKESACTNLFDFTAPITENTTIFAKWTRVTTYPISFVDEDGVTVLETQNVASGATPVYGGTTPAKTADADYRYEFAGWTPEITAVTGPATYTAVYTKIARTYGEPVWAWAEDRKSATATFTTNDGAEAFSKTATDNAPAKSVVPATCEEAGKTVYTATVTFKEQTYTNTQEDVIPATGHDYGIPTYVWADDYSTVTATRVCANDSSHVETETATTTYAVVTPATDTTSGTGRYTSEQFGNESFAVQTMDVEIPPTGYDVSYVWNKTDAGYTVTGTAVPFDTSAQTITETVAATYEVTTPASCTIDGEGTWTSAAFTNSQFAVQTKKEPIGALGHDLAAAAAKAATCDEAGNSAYWTCSRCGKFFSDAEGETEIAEGSWIIPAIGHDWNTPTYVWADDYSTVTATRTCKHDASHVETETATATSAVTKPATCEAKGETTYTATFTNTAFATQTKTEANIDAFGHDWNDPTYEWADDNSTVTATRKCKNDATHVETETVNTTSEVTKPATCETKGETTYTATFTNTAFATQTKTEANIPALGHDWGTPTYEWASDNSKVTATRTCKNDPTHVEREVADTTSKVTKPATCETKGETTYTSATFENEAFAVQTKTIADIDALGHDWDTANIEWTWAADYSSATATFTCKNDANHKNVLTASVSSTTTEATCETEGETRYRAVVTLNDGMYADTKSVVIPAIGHDWNAPTYEWASDNSKVTASRTCKNDPAHVETETVQATYAVTIEATCEAAGVGTWTSAAFDNEAFTVQTQTETIAATGHDWNAPTYEWASDNSKVTASRTCKNDSSHVETETVGATYEEVSPATDTEAGSGKWTSAAFENEAFEVQTLTVVLPPTGYNVSYEWTKTADGYTVKGTAVPYNTAADTITETVNATYEVTTQATCETEGVGTWTSAAFESSQFGVQTKTEVIGVLGHDPVKTDATAATCEAAGNNAYWTCSRCGKFFSDAEGKTEITEGSWIIPATGHDWGEPTYTWAADNSKVTATRICGNDADHVQTETVNAMSEVTKPATCETKGETTYTSAAFENEAFAVQTKTVANIDATDHDWNEPTYTWAADNSAVTATRTCKNDPAHIETETAETTSEVTKPATCEAKGEMTYTATFENSAFAVQSKTLENVEPLGHDWNAPTYTWAADNSAVTATRTCKHDASHKQTETVDATGEVTKEPTCVEEGEKIFTSEAFTNEAFAVQTKTVVTAAAGHSFKQTNAKPATCTEDGNITYYTCTKCGKHFSYEDGTTELVDNKWVIPKIGHDWNEPTYEWAADNSRVTATRTCKNDEKHIESETVNTVKVTTPVTCEDDGARTYTATFANEAFAAQTKTVVIPATGHDWSTPTYTWAEDNSKVIAKRTCANNPAHVETETVNATYTVTTPATETEAGVGTWTSAAFENEAFAVQTKTVEISPTGYEVSYEWNKTDDGYTVTGTAVPLDTSAETIYETVAAKYVVTTPAKCTTAGVGTWATEAFENPQFKVQVMNVEIDMLGHDLIMSEAHGATCEQSGNNAYWTCSRCGKFFSDTIGNVEISDGDWVTPATGHDWSEPNYTWAEDNSKVTATRICGNDADHVQTETVDTTSEVTKAATCEAKGETTYTSAAFTNSAFAVQTKTVENVDATGHDWDTANIAWIWSTDFATATAKFTCKNDGSHVETVDAKVTSATTNASCEIAGRTLYTAVVTFKGTNYSDFKETMIPATGHKYGEPIYKWGTDNLTVTGKTVCSECGGDITEQVEAKLDTEKSKAPTCEEAGKNVYTSEAFKKYSGFVAQSTEEKIPALGHTWGEWKETKAATETTEGVEERTCSICRKTETRAVPKLEPAPVPAPEPADEPGSDPTQMGADGTAVGPGASEAAAEKAITTMKNDSDPAGSVYSKFKFRSTKQTKTSITLKWTKVGKAKKYVIYGNKCGKTTKPKRIATIKNPSKTTKVFRKVAGKAVKKGTYYKFLIVALDENNNVITTSRLIHVTTKGGKYCNNKSVTVKQSVLAKAQTMTKGSSLKVNAVPVPQSKTLKVQNHTAMRYESTNKNIVTVKKGVIKAKSKGVCYVYAYDQNGRYKRIRVVVK